MKNTLNTLFTEEQVEDVSRKILKRTVDKLTNELSTSFYNEMESFLYEHYQNNYDKIHKKLVEEITEEFIKDPKGYKFAKLREKLFNENKEILIKTLTDEAIEKSVEDVIERYTHRDYTFYWRWKDAIIRIIGDNWHKFKDDERVNSRLLRQIDQLKDQVNKLKEKLQNIPEDSNWLY